MRSRFIFLAKINTYFFGNILKSQASFNFLLNFSDVVDSRIDRKLKTYRSKR